MPPLSLALFDTVSPTFNIQKQGFGKPAGVTTTSNGHAGGRSTITTPAADKSILPDRDLARRKRAPFSLIIYRKMHPTFLSANNSDFEPFVHPSARAYLYTRASPTTASPHDNRLFRALVFESLVCFGIGFDPPEALNTRRHPCCLYLFRANRHFYRHPSSIEAELSRRTHSAPWGRMEATRNLSSNGFRF